MSSLPRPPQTSWWHGRAQTSTHSLGVTDRKTQFRAPYSCESDNGRTVTYVRPMMECACPVWHSSASAVDALALERVQASVARTILAADWDTPKDILFRQLDWPSLRWRRTILSMTLFHQLVHHGEGPLMECMFPLSSATGRNVRKPHQLILGMASSTKRLNGFFYSAAILWNTLPAKIQNITNPRLFRASLEDRLSRQKYNPLQNPDL